jgi:CNT family concentrative nucleoside transporter
MDFLYDLFRTLLGMSVMLAVCYAFSANRRAIDWKLVGIGVSMQFVLAVLILKVNGVSTLFDYVAAGFRKTLEFTSAGAQFLFGNIVTDLDSFGYIFAFQVLPTIVFFSALSAILYYLGILQKVVYGLAWLLSKAMGLSGPESLAAAANVFIGQTEAPLVVKPYLERMTRSELLCVMVGGMATIAGSVFVSYIGFLGGTDPESQQFFARHLLTASIISAPAAIVCAKMLLPEDKAELAAVTGAATTDPHAAKAPERDERLEMAADDSNNLLDAISRGTTDGLKLAVNVGAMLLVFTALIYMLNVFFTGGTDLINWVVLEAPEWVRWNFDSGAFDNAEEDGQTWNQLIAQSTQGRFEGFSFTYLLALLFAPVAWIIGIPFEDITVVGQLLGLKTVINEFVAYDTFQTIQASGATLSPKSTLIAAYALCGFANFASIGIQVGGIGAIAPGQRKNLTELGLPALLGGTVACLMTGTIAGLFY